MPELSGIHSADEHLRHRAGNQTSSLSSWRSWWRQSFLWLYPSTSSPLVSKEMPELSGIHSADQLSRTRLESPCQERLPVSNNHNRDDASAGLSRIEVGTDGLPHRKLPALITTKPNRGRGTVLQEGNEGDLHRRPISSNDGTQLYNAEPLTLEEPAGRAPRIKMLPQPGRVRTRQSSRKERRDFMDLSPHENLIKLYTRACYLCLLSSQSPFRVPGPSGARCS